VRRQCADETEHANCDNNGTTLQGQVHVAMDDPASCNFQKKRTGLTCNKGTKLIRALSEKNMLLCVSASVFFFNLPEFQ